MQRKDGQTYAPVGKVQKVCKDGEFQVGVVGLDHGHIYGMCNGLFEAGATIRSVYDRDPKKVDDFCKSFPSAVVASDPSEIYSDEKVSLVATAAIPSERASVAKKALLSDKHVFSDKPGFTTFDQLEEIRALVNRTQKRYGIYFSERLHVEAATYADALISDGKIGRVVQTMVMGPHRLNKESRPDWFFDKGQYGGIIVDIGSHQIDQILHYNGATSAKVITSNVANYALAEYPLFEDFGSASLECDNNTSGYFRVDWFTPSGLNAWGDGRTFILGTEGYIELRKYVDVARADAGNFVYYANKDGEFCIDANNTLGFPFFGLFIRDCLDGTEHSNGQGYVFTVMELALKAQNQATKLE